MSELSLASWDSIADLPSGEKGVKVMNSWLNGQKALSAASPSRV